MVEVDARPLATWLATRHLPQPCRERLFVASPDFVADFLGDHSVADMEVVQQAHLHLGADGERAIIEAVARDAKCSPRVIEYAVGGARMASPYEFSSAPLVSILSRLSAIHSSFSASMR